MKPAIIPENLSGKELYDFLVKNESLIIHAKKSEVKKADSIIVSPMFIDDKGKQVSKAEIEQVSVDPSKIKVKLVINTTNWFDSHWDVHIPGLWKKSLADNKNGFYLLESHGRNFQDVIAEGCEGYTKNYSWRDLGFDLTGITEALVFDGTLDKLRNEYMFTQYQKGYVKKHSVGKQNIKMVTCINDDDYPVQKENWDKYIEMVANKQDAIDSGYFWAILEAQVVEGSAVLFASNCMTPTLSVLEVKTDTDEQPSLDTAKQPSQRSSLDIKQLLQIF